MFKKYKEKFIGDREFYANLIRLIIPMIVQQGITSFVSLLDNVMVGRLGTESMSGVAIVNQLLFVFNLTIFGGLAGASIFGAQFYGKGDHKGVRYALRFKLIFSVLMAVIAIVALLFFNNPLISLFLTESESGGDLVLTLSEAKNYLFVMLIGLIPFSFSQSYSSTLRETGETVSPMTASIIAIVTNFVLNYILIFGSFGAPRLGVVGAAIATVAAQLISTLGCFLYAFLKYPELRLHREDWRITRRDVTRHLIQGIPLGLQFSVLAIGIIVMQSVIVQFDTLGGEMVSNAAQNGFGAANKLNNLLMTPLNGLGAAMTSFTAQNLGAGDHARIKKGTVQALIIVWTMCLISIAAGLLLSRGGGYLYIFLSPDKVTAETMRYGNTYLYVDLSLYLFLGFIFVVRNCVQGIGKPQFVLGAGAAELAARVSVCLLLPPLIAGGPVNSDAPRAAVYALCFADPFAWMAADAVLLVPFLRNIMKMDYRYLKGTM